jgi:hypothetical protein
MLVESFGFPAASLFFAAAILAVGLVDGLEWLRIRNRRSYKELNSS